MSLRNPLTCVLLAFLFLLSSCRTSSDVMSNGLIHKSKYTGGFYVEHARERKVMSPAGKDESISIHGIEEETNLSTAEPIAEESKPAIAPNPAIKRKPEFHEDRYKPLNITRQVIGSVAEKFTSAFHPQANVDPISFNSSNKKKGPGMAMGKVSFILGWIGLYLFPFWMGCGAITFGIISLIQTGAKDRKRKKSDSNKSSATKTKRNGKGKRKAWRKKRKYALWGVILGVVDIVALIVLLAIFGPSFFIMV